MDYGINYEAWADRRLRPNSDLSPTNREFYFEPVATEDAENMESWQSMRTFLQDYFKKRNISF